MLNQNHNVHKRTNSKILLIVICIFGLLFSYSCSCKNNVTGPGNDGLENGKVTNITPTGDSNAFIPVANKVYNATNSALIAKKDGTTKTDVKIKFKEDNGHNIKNAKLIKTADTNGTEVTGASYDFQNSSFGFTAAELQTMLDNMDSTTSPATNILTLTFEVTTDDTTTTNTTATVEDVKVEIIKTQEFDNQATILQGIIGSLTPQLPSNRVQFNFSADKAGISSIDLSNILEDKGPADNNDAASFVNDMIDEIKTKPDYQKYFDDVKTANDPTGIGTTVLNIKLTFTPKNLYDMTLVDYTMKLDNTHGGNWISGK